MTHHQVFYKVLSEKIGLKNEEQKNIKVNETNAFSPSQFREFQILDVINVNYNTKILKIKVFFFFLSLSLLKKYLFHF